MFIRNALYLFFNFIFLFFLKFRIKFKPSLIRAVMISIVISKLIKIIITLKTRMTSKQQCLRTAKERIVVLIALFKYS